MLEPHETWKLVEGNHLPALGELESRILAARVTGWKPPGIASRLFRNEREVRRLIERLEDQVCAPAGAERDVGLLVLWFSLHTACRYRCAPAAQEMIANGAVFPPGNTPGRS